MPDAQPRVSVLIPVYNVAPYIERSLVSLQRQTISDIQIVVVDDCSTDETALVVQRLAAEDPRIELTRTIQNQGIVGALNHGLRFCRAPYIARMDGDDVAVPERLQRQLEFLEKHPDVALVGCATSAIDCDDQRIDCLGVSKVPVGAAAIRRTLNLAPPCSHIWLARAELYRALSGYRALAPAEDYDFLLRTVTAGFQIGNIPEPLMKIRMRPGNSADVTGLKQRKAHRYVVRLFEERLKTGQDSFNTLKMQDAVRGSRFEHFTHRHAVRLVKNALAAHTRSKKFLLLAVAATISHWQARYFLDRARQKLLLRWLDASAQA